MSTKHVFFFLILTALYGICTYFINKYIFFVKGFLKSIVFIIRYRQRNIERTEDKEGKR